MNRSDWFSLTVSATFFLCGCSKPQVAAQGDRGISATYSLGRLSAVLPPEAGVPSVIAAADQTARARGYTVVSSSSTEEWGDVICRPPRSDSFPRVVIHAARTASGTGVTIEMQPFGDQDLCRSMLDGVLQRLGM